MRQQPKVLKNHAQLAPLLAGGGSNDKTVGYTGSTNQFWTGGNGSRCGSYSGSLSWSFASDGRLMVTLGGRTVSLS